MIAGAGAIYVAAAVTMVALHAQQSSKLTLQPTSLKALPVPEPPNLADFVADKQAAIVLGKALFWDQQASSDNQMACASCHFHAGADNRVKNQLNPGQAGRTATLRHRSARRSKGGPNYTLTAADFPFHRLSDPNDRDSVVLFDSDDVAGSAGVFNSDYKKNVGIVEQQTYYPDGVFQVGSLETRRVTGRNAPTVINAALNFRNFWDGRANFVFNGVTPFGPRDKDAQIWVEDYYTNAQGVQVQRAVKAYARIPYAALASQAVGPALSAFEMSGASRAFSDLGHKMLLARPLVNQQIATTDSVLGPYRHPFGYGLNTTYEALIKKAFQPEYWRVPDATFQASSGTGYRQIEANFSLFWGLAIQLYESTLISDDSRFDRFADGDKTQLTAQEQLGLAIFTSERAKCVSCHKGPEFTGASIRNVVGSHDSSDGPIENMLMGDGASAIYDNGFYNIGVDADLAGHRRRRHRPVGATRCRSRAASRTCSAGCSRPTRIRTASTRACGRRSAAAPSCARPSTRDAVDGSFKTPTLRNIELTGPYFHNGGYATLEQVVDFYNRGGNKRSTANGDTTGYGGNTSNFDSDVMRLGLSDAEKAALVAFLKSLTDERVRYEKAPFDHPSLKVPNGHKGDNVTVQSPDGKKAIDELMTLPAVGAAGIAAPIKPFQQ